MVDVFSPEERSRIMAKVRSKDTKPELLVRSIVHRLGYRFRLHDKSLVGNPDIVLKRHRKIIFVNGCFWHQHPGCIHAERPASNTDYWNKKLDRTIERDRINLKKLDAQGWDILVVWECETRDIDALTERLARFLRCKC